MLLVRTHLLRFTFQHLLDRYTEVFWQDKQPSISYRQEGGKMTITDDDRDTNLLTAEKKIFILSQEMKDRLREALNDVSHCFL